MVVELLQDLERPAGYWLIVDASEQSFVDLADPTYLEFEYVQMIGYVLQAAFRHDTAVTALHLGGGLCSVPRWLAELHPGSRQLVVENSPEIAEMARSLGGLERIVDLVVADGLEVLSTVAAASLDLLVCDVYEGPETVLSVFPRDVLERTHAALRTGGWYVCNLSDADPFEFAKTVIATLREVFGAVVMLAEPAVLRGRRSGNIVLAATDGVIPLSSLQRLAAGGPVRARVVSGDGLTEFVGSAAAADDVAAIPPSGESPGRRFR
jgi:spermidine synthase